MAEQESRRDFIKRTNGLILGFSLAGRRPAAAQSLTPGAYGPPVDEVDSWLVIGTDGTATLYTGCCELGTGSSTGLLQIMAEELDLPVDSTRLVGPDTSRTPDQFVSSGSRTIAVHGIPIRQAAAEARQELINLAARRLGVPADQLTTANGVVLMESQPQRRVTFGELIGGRRFDRKLTGTAKPKLPREYKVVGTSVPRIDIPDKVFGTFTYLQDVKVPGMLHGRVIRPNSQGGKLLAIDEASVARLPGLVKVVRRGDLVGVVCRREEQAIRAAASLKVKWSAWAGLPDSKELYTRVRALPEYAAGYPPRFPGGMLDRAGDVERTLAQASAVLRATYESPYHHHGSIGPSCAIADVHPDGATVWCATQTPYGLREAAAKFLGLPNEKVRLIYVEASGCYGQNGADDVVIDAIVLSQAAGRPVRVQWSRADENGWESLKGARVSDVVGGLDSKGGVVAWDSRTFGFSGYSRPEYHEPRHGGEPGSLVTAQLANWTEPGIEEGYNGAVSNFPPVYAFPNRRVVFTYLGPDSHREGPLRIRVGSMRGIGSPDNVFVNESFVDELAAAAGADAVEFRLRHLRSSRHIDVLRSAATTANWESRPSGRRPPSGDLARGRGVALLGPDHFGAKGEDTCAAAVCEVAVHRATGVVKVVRVVLAQDCGLVVNPDAVRNQIEGAVIQSISRALLEEAKFDRSRITSLDWASYPILRFPDIPDEIQIVLADRPDLPPLRVGEPASETIWPALANAIFDAVGVRLRRLPFTPERVLGR